MKTALILFAHGARDPEWANPMRRVQAILQQQVVGIDVELAFLEFTAPTLADCAEKSIAQGARRILVVPLFIARGGHLKREVPEMLDVLRSTYPEVEFTLTPPIGENESVIHAMAAAVLGEAGLPIA